MELCTANTWEEINVGDQPSSLGVFQILQSHGVDSTVAMISPGNSKMVS